nr:hypothetical protein [Tanacetum cinerariifolium]
TYTSVSSPIEDYSDIGSPEVNGPLSPDYAPLSPDYMPGLEEPEQIRGDDEEVLTDDEFSDLEEENLRKGNKIAKIFKIEMDMFLFETPLCKEFKEFNHLFQIDVDVLTGDLLGFKTYDDYKNTWIYEWNNEVPWIQEYWHGKKDEEESCEDAGSNHVSNNEWEHYEHTTYINTDVNSNYNTYNNVCQMFKNRVGINNDDDAIEMNQEWFDDHEPMEEDDDDIGDLDDYLIPKDVPYYVDEDEEGFK